MVANQESGMEETLQERFISEHEELRQALSTAHRRATQNAERATGAVLRADAAEERVRFLEALLDAPELRDFSKAVQLEAAHQRKRWGSAHDAGKHPSDWFWLIGYLAGKALHAHTAGDEEKALHHTITAAAALANWHAAILGKTDMRPGIEAPEEVMAHG
jgi:hypothetical protein